MLLTILLCLISGCNNTKKELKQINTETDKTESYQIYDSSIQDKNKQRKQDLFENFYENIPSSAEKCSKDSSFKLIYHTKESNNLSFYAEQSAVDEECIASSTNIKITYWKNDWSNSVQILVLNGTTELHSLSQYIGVKREILIKDFPEIPSEENESSVITLTSKDWMYFITFILKDDVVASITLGKNL